MIAATTSDARGRSSINPTFDDSSFPEIGSHRFLRRDETGAHQHARGAQGKRRGKTAPIRYAAGRDDRYADCVDDFRYESECADGRVWRSPPSRPMPAGFASLRHDRIGARVLSCLCVADSFHHYHHVDAAVVTARHGVARRQAKADAPHWHALLEDHVNRGIDRVGAAGWRGVRLREAEDTPRGIQRGIGCRHFLRRQRCRIDRRQQFRMEP